MKKTIIKARTYKELES